MLLIHTALSSEAKPLTAALGLRPEAPAASLRLFSRDDLFLVVSGTGSRRAAAAVGFAMGLLRERFGWYPAALNTGLCGAVDSRRELGRAFLINHCRAAADGRRHVPDVLFRHRLEEAGLHTFDQVVDSPEKVVERFPGIDLLDMEGSGFWEAASAFLSPSRIQSVKIVGDHLREARAITPSVVENRMREALPAVVGFLDDFRQHLTENRREEEDGTNPMVAAWSEALRLTETQRQQLCDASLYASLSGEDFPPARLGAPPPQPPRHKRERNRQFERLLEILHESANSSI